MTNTSKCMDPKSGGFTLIELLVVVAIISLLVSILLPSLRSAKELAKISVCLNNNRTIGLSIAMYTSEEDDFYPVPPLGYGSGGVDEGVTYAAYMYGGDDIGFWAEMFTMPADVRPLAKHIDPYSEVYHCPSDDVAYPWMYGGTLWEDGTTSYSYNANGEVSWGFTGLYGIQSSEVTTPNLTIAVGDSPWGAIRPNLPDNDFLLVQTNPDMWFHLKGFEQFKVCLAFTDGHAAYMPIEIRVRNTSTYRMDP